MVLILIVTIHHQINNKGITIVVPSQDRQVQEDHEDHEVQEVEGQSL